jgi:hypothetical protein
MLETREGLLCLSQLDDLVGRLNGTAVRALGSPSRRPLKCARKDTFSHLCEQPRNARFAGKKPANPYRASNASEAFRSRPISSRSKA